MAAKLTREEKYMKAAIREAKKAWALGEVPIGCVIVYEDKIIGRGYNRRMVDHSALAHAEIAAIKKACKRMGDWRLEEWNRARCAQGRSCRRGFQKFTSVP